MAKLDNLIGMMVQQHVERAVLVNDRSAHLFSGGQDRPGPIIPGAQLQLVVQEVTPEHLKAQLAQSGQVAFTYASPHGTFDVQVERSSSGMQVTVIPHANGTPALNSIANGTANKHAAYDGDIATYNLDAALEDALAPNASMAEIGDHTGHVAAVPSGPLRKPQHMDELFRLMKTREASDLHLSSDEYPIMRIHGKIVLLKEYEKFTHETLKALLWPIAPQRNKDEWESDKDSDFAYAIEGVARFRCNFFADRKGIGAVFRLIPSEVLTVEQLKLPKACTDLCFLSKGLVVVTGPTGSGKSTTLAAMIDFINKHRDDHIITIEDPVEFVHENKKCLINQREVHVHTAGFKRALRAALREDPDIVLVGEMRDLETIAIAIETAETGHLVFGTLHTTTAPSTVDRIIDQFPSDQQAQIRVMLSESLKGVIAQTLLRTVDGKRAAAHEILLVPAGVSNLIREGKTFQLPSQMQIGKNMGMITMNDSILKLVIDGRVDPHEGYVKAVDKVGLLQSYEANDINYDPTDVKE
jgi:twitching motility protein PilT